MYIKRSHSGFSTFEILIATGILVAVVVAVSGSLRAFVLLHVHTHELTQTALLLEEGSEALQVLRDTSWSEQIATTTLDTTYHLYWNGSTYTLSATPSPIDGKWYREVVFHEVRRDSSGVLDDTGDVDVNTRQAVITISKLDGTILDSAQMLIHNSYAE